MEALERAFSKVPPPYAVQRPDGADSCGWTPLVALEVATAVLAEGGAQRRSVLLGQVRATAASLLPRRGLYRLR
eukprot:6723631-Pyramimonas_sp.AAC.1